MPQETVDARIRDILADVLLLDEAKVRAMTGDSHIIKDLGAESINVAEITVALENEFNLAIEDEQMRGIYTVSALIAFVEAENAK